VTAGRGVDQLSCNPHPSAGTADTALENVTDAEFARDLGDIDSRALVSESRAARDHKEGAIVRQRRDDVLDDAVGEIFLLRVAAHVLERQDCNRRLFWQRQWRCRGQIQRHCWPFYGGPDIEYADRAGDVLDLLLAPVSKGEIELVAHLVTHHAADADPARLGQGFEPCGDIDAVTEDILAVDDDVAEVDPDPELDPLGIRRPGIPQDHLALHIDRAAHRIDDAGKLDEQPVAGRFDDAAAMLLDLWIGQFAPDRL
jgi:hypothetical protein